MNFFKSLLFFSFLLFSITAKGQFNIDTLSDVNIISKRMPIKPFFSTFSSNVFTRDKTFNYTRTNFGDSVNEFFCPLAIRVENNTKHKIKLDFLLVKGTPIDISRVTIFFDVFQSNKRWSTSKVKLVDRGKKIIAMTFEKDTYLPIGTSYISFSFYKKNDFDFKFYVNNKIEGYMYSYDKKLDLFQLFNTDDMPPIPTPQIKLFYTRLDYNQD